MTKRRPYNLMEYVSCGLEEVNFREGFPGGSEGKASACNARSPGEGNGNPLQYCCLEKSMDRRSLVDYSPWDRKESDRTEQLHFTSLQTSENRDQEMATNVTDSKTKARSRVLTEHSDSNLK